MAFARTGGGPVADFRALASQVHPVFMLPPLAASAFGAVLARDAGARVDLGLAALHLVAVFCALYTAHVKDGYVDFYGRGEDDDHPMTERGCRRTLALSSVGFFAALAGVYALAGAVAALLTLPGWLIGYFHAPQLDTNPVTVTTGYPLGIGFALVGGYYLQAGALAATPAAFAGVFVVVLSGIKVVDDATDYDYDRSIDKRTVAVALGRERARPVAFAIMATGMLVVLALATLSEVFPQSAVIAPVGFVAVAFLTRRLDAERSTMVLVRGSYVFMALLVVAVWWRPFG